MNTVIVRYGEIGTKSGHVRNKMTHVLLQRIQDILNYKELEYTKVSSKYGRIFIDTKEALKAAKLVSKVPGVSTASPAYRAEPSIDSLKQKSEELEVGETFGVDTNNAGKHSFGSQEVNIQLGSHIEQVKGAEVDLDNPDTLVEVDIREESAYIFTQRFQGPDGYPVGTQGDYAALISGGIDSPVAAYRLMTRGADIVPIYFYNKPIAAEDHFLRFKASINHLKKYNPSKDWYGYKVDMEEVNKQLMDVERGRMVLYRKIMFRTAEKIAEKEGLKGILTGESLGQKSSQTSSNLEKTSSSISKPVLRPLLTSPKKNIVQQARKIGTFEEASIDSACSTLSPESPATSIKEEDLRELEKTVDIDKQVEKALEATEKVEL